jgi:hypothetical protein
VPAEDYGFSRSFTVELFEKGTAPKAGEKLNERSTKCQGTALAAPEQVRNVL